MPPPSCPVSKQTARRYLQETSANFSSWARLLIASEGRLPSHVMMYRYALLTLAVLLPGALAVRRLDLTATSGETAGKYAFEGGEEEATCKACMAVVSYIERKMAEIPKTNQVITTGKKKAIANRRMSTDLGGSAAGRVWNIHRSNLKFCQHQLKF